MSIQNKPTTNRRELLDDMTIHIIPDDDDFIYGIRIENGNDAIPIAIPIKIKPITSIAININTYHMPSWELLRYRNSYIDADNNSSTENQQNTRNPIRVLNIYRPFEELNFIANDYKCSYCLICMLIFTIVVMISMAFGILVLFDII